MEIHQGTVDSSDISFDLDLVATLARPDPELTLAAHGGSLLLRWPVLAGSYHLEETSSFSAPVAWTPVTNGIASDGFWQTFTPVNTPASPQLFFRLSTP